MKKVLIIGSGRSGQAAARLLEGRAECFIWDDKISSQKRPRVADFDELLLSPGVPLDHAMALEARRLNKRITGELELAYENCRGEFIAITGTNGKTTTTALTAEIFKAAGFDARVVGNIGNPVSGEALSAGIDTKMITEVSSFQLETVSEFHPHIAAVLNITPDHLDRHKSFDTYAGLKMSIGSNQELGDYFIYNADDPEILARLGEPKAEAVPFSLSDELPFAIERISLPGRHNMENALAAAAICRCAGIDRQLILDCIAAFKGVEHRLEAVRELRGVRYVNDSKGTNPDSSIKAIEAYSGGIILIAGGYEKNADFSDLIKSFKGKVKYILTIGATGERFAKRAVELGFDSERIKACDTMEDCVARGSALAVSGDTVLLSPACASWDMYGSFEERGEHFKRLVNSL